MAVYKSEKADIGLDFESDKPRMKAKLRVLVAEL